MKLRLVLHGLFVFGISFSTLMVSCNLLGTLEGNKDPSSFSSNFLFGTGSSSYQFEGAFLSDGKGLNNWDIFSHKPGTITDGTTGDISVDQYHRYLEDIDLMDYIGVNSYRFSISWARILPKGRFGKVNEAGINYYNKLIDALLHKGIQPFVALTHYDSPQELEDRYGSWLNAEVQEDFKYYAEICFKYFGDRVKYWATFNEPNAVAIYGYRYGTIAPGRCSGFFGNCESGDSEREPFIAAYNMILSHAEAVYIYRSKYQKEQGGSIGIIMNTFWFEPYSNSTEDKLAVERAQSFYMNWILDPIIFGKYPTEMQEILGSLLPEFSEKQLEILKMSLDFIGINHYSSFYIKDCMFSVCRPAPGASKTEGFTLRTPIKNGVLIGNSTAASWLYVYPPGMEKMVTYLKDRYGNIPMFVTENGYCEKGSPNSTSEASLNDIKRVEYMNHYLDALETSKRKGADVRGYFAWSLLDNFEWTDGFTLRFGLYHVDIVTLKRTPRLSVAWYKEYIANHTTQSRGAFK